MWIAIPLLVLAQDPEPTTPHPEEVRIAGQLIGLDFTDEEIELLLRNVAANLAKYERMRERHLDNGVLPAVTFSPFTPGVGHRAEPPMREPLELADVERPADLEELAFADIPTLAALIKGRKVTCVELVEMFLARLERLDRRLHCVITLLPERALARAQELDRELEEGRWRGPLHGIPWGAKDLLAVRGAPTTWGAKPFEDQVLDLDATVVKKLDDAGAVLVAKLSLGALAMGDVWFGERTRSPWNPETGSSGSSAGSASATAAGGVTFAIGSETLGSIVSPSTRCGNSSLRPTFGAVSRHGAMTLSWSLDKLGPLCRSAIDAAIVMDAIRGPDGLDPTVSEMEFSWPGPSAAEMVNGMRVGYPKGAFQEESKVRLEELEALGCELVEVELPSFPVRDMLIVLNAEAATAFDELTRSGRDDELVRQGAGAWPNSFRTARLIPAVEYIRAQRLRTLLMQEFDQALADVDALVHENYANGLLSITNLTGHPTFVAPTEVRDGRGGRSPGSISFTGQLYDDARLCALVHVWQEATGHHREHPPLEWLDAAAEPGGDGGDGR